MSRYLPTLEHNISLQDDLYKLRSETKEAFDEAKALEARWAELQREQKDVFQVGDRYFLICADFYPLQALHAAIPSHASPSRDYCPGRSL